MTRRTWLGLAAAPALAAAARSQDTAPDAGVEVHEMVEAVWFALTSGRPDRALVFFDAKTPGYRRLAQDLQLLLRRYLAPSKIAFLSNTGDDKSRDLELDWTLQIRTYNGQSSTSRRARVKIRAEKEADGWRVTQFAPVDLFQSPNSGAIWDVIAGAASALTEINGGSSDAEARIPAIFLGAFDRKMPGYDQLRQNVVALLQLGDVESGVTLVQDEGDDRRRTVELDWNLSVVPQATKVAVLRREQRVTCVLEKRKGKWQIVSFEPLAFLAPASPKPTKQ